jgi:hypothetical protein
MGLCQHQSGKHQKIGGTALSQEMAFFCFFDQKVLSAKNLAFKKM